MRYIANKLGRLLILGRIFITQMFVFQIAGRFHWLFLVFKNAGERSTAKNYHHVSFLSVVSKVLEKLVNNRIVDHLEKCGLFSDF